MTLFLIMAAVCFFFGPICLGRDHMVPKIGANQPALGCWGVGVGGARGGSTEGVCVPPLLFVRACAQALICHEGGPTGLV